MYAASELNIDHVVLLVDDLEAGIADYATLGFTVVPGGDHADGITHNALIAFQDGSYLEIVAFKQPPPEGHIFAHGARVGEGLIAYALLPRDIERTVRAADDRGLHLNGPIPGGRKRPDGREIAWKTARAETPDLPFLCADVTPRKYRVPEGDVRKHANGVTGIAGLTVAVAELEASRRRYHALLGTNQLSGFGMPPSREPVAAFQLGDTTITLIQPVLGPAHEHMERCGEGVFALALRAGREDTYGFLEPERTHGSRLEVVHEVASPHRQMEAQND